MERFLATGYSLETMGYRFLEIFVGRGQGCDGGGQSCDRGALPVSPIGKSSAIG